MVNWDKKDVCVDLINVLACDGVMLASCDTVLGLFAQLSEKGKCKLDAIKVRNNKPYIVLLPDMKNIYDYIDQEMSATMLDIMQQYWPGPLTIIFKAKSTLPAWLQSSQGTLAIRIPDHQGLQILLQKIPGLFTTSANISDQPLPKSYAEINPEILQQVQIVCCRQDERYDGLASTIVDFSSGSIKVIRQGTIVLNSI